MGCSSSTTQTRVQPNDISCENKNGRTKVHPDGQIVSTGNKSSSVHPTDVIDESGLVFHEQQINTDNLISLCKKGKEQDIRELLGKVGIDVNVKGMWSNTPLIVACQYGHESIALFLLENDKIDVNHTNDNGATALLYACIEGMGNVVKRLLLLTAQVNPPPSIVYNPSTDRSNFMSPLSAAVINGHLELVGALLDAGSDVNCTLQLKNEYVKDSSTLVQGVSVLMLACRHQREDIITELVKRGADQGQRDSDGCSIIHYACRSGTSSHKVLGAIMSCIIVPPSLICATDHANNTALHIACENKCIPAAKILLESSLFVAPSTVEPSESSTTDTAIDISAYVNTLNSAGLSPLHIAVKKRSAELVKLLLDNKADPHVKQSGVEKGSPSAYEMALKLRADSEIHKLVIKRDGQADRVGSSEDTSRPVTPTKTSENEQSGHGGNCEQASSGDSDHFKKEDGNGVDAEDMRKGEVVNGDEVGEDPLAPECSDSANASPIADKLLVLQTPKKTPDRHLQEMEYNRITSAPKKEASAEKGVRPPSPIKAIQF